MNLSNKEMKIHQSYPNYAVTRDGRVWSFKRNIILKPFLSNSGYEQVTLAGVSQKPKKVYVHRLVAELYLAPVTGLNCVNHKDSNKTNNHMNNLEWTNHSLNMLHASAAGKLNPYRKYSDEEVQEVLDKHKEGASIKQIAKYNGMHVEHVRNILKGKYVFQHDDKGATTIP